MRNARKIKVQKMSNYKQPWKRPFDSNNRRVMIFTNQSYGLFFTGRLWFVKKSISYCNVRPNYEIHAMSVIQAYCTALGRKLNCILYDFQPRLSEHGVANRYYYLIYLFNFVYSKIKCDRFKAAVLQLLKK